MLHMQFGSMSMSLEYTQIMMSACFLIFGVASGYRTTHIKHSSALRNSPIKDVPSVSRYEHVLLEIQQPLSGPNKIVQTLLNDDIISKVVPMVGRSLYVYICASVDLPKSVVCEYISDTYSRIWDEMLVNHLIKIDCVVVGDVYGSDFASRTQMRSLPNLNALCTFDGEGRDGMDLSRSNNQLSKVSFVHTNSLITPSPTVAGTPGAAAIYYFDADSVHIPKFKKVALGGTFDQLHNGHRKLLTLGAASSAEILIIGVMSDELLKNKKNSESILPYKERQECLEKFLGIAKPNLKYEIVPLLDPYGPTISDPTIDALVVSSETLNGAYKINQIRLDKGFKPLVILVSRRSGAATMSSTFIREKNSPPPTKEHSS